VQTDATKTIAGLLSPASVGVVKIDLDISGLGVGQEEQTVRPYPGAPIADSLSQPASDGGSHPPLELNYQKVVSQRMIFAEVN
jgi:hypothetical protein